jgi:sulfur relay (sulfurtransferase) complex TusBCD TusD component (DsrE family)
MNLGIVIYSTDPEAVWNAFRLGNYALKQGDTVKVFLLAKGVECRRLWTPAAGFWLAALVSNSAILKAPSFVRSRR